MAHVTAINEEHMGETEQDKLTREAKKRRAAYVLQLLLDATIFKNDVSKLTLSVMEDKFAVDDVYASLDDALRTLNASLSEDVDRVHRMLHMSSVKEAKAGGYLDYEAWQRRMRNKQHLRRRAETLANVGRKQS